ncbi:MAG: hypothetical protein HY808_00935 [Nitrospirae bacterium]|nr:hypothetical protein [Nitrospirota bacterium]
MEDIKLPRSTSLLCSLLLLVLISFSGVSISSAESELHLSDELSLTHNDITGPGSLSSSLTEGTHYLNVLGINGNGTVSRFDYTFNIGSKATDDPRNDVKNISLTNLNLKLTDKVNTVNIGDTFESFSQYSLSSALKGVSYRFYNKEANSPEVIIVYGAAHPRWDSMWRDIDTMSLERQAGAARIKYGFNDELDAGISLLKSEDDKIFMGSPLYDNLIYEIDAEYRPIAGLTVNAEAAINETSEIPSAGAADISSHGSAFKIGAVGDGGPSRVTLEYERVSPEFITLLGSATADREKFKANWRYKYDKNISIKTGFLWYRDNLKGQKTSGRTDHYKPEIGVTVKKVFDRQYAAADIGYKLDISENNNNTTKVDNILDLNYRDRFGIFDSDTNLGYTSYDGKGTSESEEFTYNTSLNSRHTSGRFIFKPAVYLGGWTSNDELDDTSDVIYEYSAGLGVDIPDMKITSNIKVGQNKLDKDSAGADDSSKIFANMSIYYRPGLLSRLNQGMLYLRAYVNDFNYTTGTKDFRESSITTGINIQI